MASAKWPATSTAGRTLSATGQYDSGAFSSALAYTDIKDARAASTRMYGLGATYQLGAFKPFGVITQVKNTATSAKATTYELGTVYALTALWDLSAAYQFQNRNQGVGNARPSSPWPTTRSPSVPTCMWARSMTVTRATTPIRSLAAAYSRPPATSRPCAWVCAIASGAVASS
jgi:hypothetical protein